MQNYLFFWNYWINNDRVEDVKVFVQVFNESDGFINIIFYVNRCYVSISVIDIEIGILQIFLQYVYIML